MPKFNGKVTLAEFKKAAVRLEVLGQEADGEWKRALEGVRTWKKAALVLPFRHPMLAIAAGEEV